MQPATLTDDTTRDAAPVSPGPAAARDRFVINLSASTSPVALTPPNHAGLKRFTFFVSRRREEGRERFRLHMGYFESQEEAEKLLDIVREIYPGAWAGLAPGQRLRSAAAAPQRSALLEVRAADLPPPAPTAAAASAEMAIAPAVAAASAAVVSTAAVGTAPPSIAPVSTTPVAAAPIEPVVAVAASLNAESFELMPDAPPVATAVGTIPAETSALSLMPDEGRGAEVAAATDSQAAALSLNNVRAAIASLEDPSVSAPTLRPIPQLKAAATVKATTLSLPVQPAVSTGSEPTVELSNEAALRLLERGGTTRSPSAVEIPSAAAAKPKTVQATPGSEKAQYAVQLLWSVQPIDISQVPQLAIFSAYTLYGAEGNRDGRRWYGLRLGFFTDAVSAKQVAHYVRSEFSTVSVVPVTVRERERARLASTRPAVTAAAGAVAPLPKKTEFQFIEDKTPAVPAAPAPTRSARGAPGKRAKQRPAGQINPRARSKPMTLEETLEILGAGQLQMDDGRGALINEAAPRAAPAGTAKGKSSKLGRLFERLSERLGS